MDFLDSAKRTICMLASIVYFFMGIFTTGCGGGGASVPIAPPNPPSISSFATAASLIPLGGNTQVTGVFSGGSGVLTPGNSAVVSGIPVMVTPTTTTTYTLTITNTSGIQTSATSKVAVGSFTANGLMSTARACHSATLLPSGKVLLAGGINYPNGPTETILSSAEVFDPVLGTSMVVGSMSIGRTGHTATLLPSGKVLIAGGAEETTQLATAELFDPITNTFTLTGSMTIGRASHTATLLLNGMVLLAGGEKIDSSYMVGIPQAELFNPSTGTFSVTGSLGTGRAAAVAVLLPNGEVFIADGSGPTGVDIAGAEVYNPATSLFSTVSTGGIPGQNIAVILPNGQVFLAGGGGSVVFDSTTDAFSASGSYSPIGPAVMLPIGLVLSMGGLTRPTQDAEIYDPTTGNFSSMGGMTDARCSHTVTLLNDGSVLVTGGVPSVAAYAQSLQTMELFHMD